MKANRKPIRRWWIPAVLVGGGLIAGAMTYSRKAEPVEVLVAAPTYGDLERIVTTNGTVVPIGEFQARASFPGMVEKVYVELGDTVRPGQMLVSMKDPFASARIATATSALQAATLFNQNIDQGGSKEEKMNFAGDIKHAQIDQAREAKTLAALKQLQQKGAASKAEVDAAEQRLESAETWVQTATERNSDRFSAGDVRNAEAKVTDAQASLDSAKVTFANANIMSPVSGTVYSIPVSAYDFVPMGADLLRVADLSRVQIRAYFDEPEIGKLVAGQKVTVTWDGRPGRSWIGHIKQAPVAAMVLGARSVGECILLVDDAKGDLLPNTNVMLTVTIQQHHDVMLLPRAALHTEHGANFVYRVIGDRLLKTPVELGLINLDHFEITHGVTQSDTVALTSTDNRDLADNQLVMVKR